MTALYTKLLGVFVCLLAIESTAWAQPQSPNLTPELGSVLLPTPAAASLGRYIEQPISLHTGLPTINVPIWQIKRGDINVDIGLSYHGGGIKVDELASWAGIGWTLRGAGMVTRTARGLPDNIEAFRQFDLPQLNRYFSHEMTRKEEKEFLYDVYTGVKDAEPDLYTVSAPGLSCQFYLGVDGEYVTIPREANLRIQSLVRNEQGKTYTWLITDGRGVQYKFWAADETRTTYTSPGNSGFPSSEYSGESSWMLDEIEDTKGYQVQFGYVAEGTNFSTIASERFSYSTTRSTDCMDKTDASYTWSSTDGRAQRLATITCGLEQVRFVARTTERLDAHYSYGLARVEIAYAGQVKRRFQLFTSYWGADAIGTRGVNYPDVQNQSRLRLDSLREESADGILTKPATRFAYEPGSLPYRGSAAQDHWGYANGQDNRTRVSYVLGGRKAGANKEPYPAYSKAGVLTAIRHPTGGTTEFSYEPNYHVQYSAAMPYDSVVAGGMLVTNPTQEIYSADFPFTIESSLAGPKGPIVQLDISKQASINGVPQDPAKQAGFTWNIVLYRPDGTPVPLMTAASSNQMSLPPGNYRLHLDIDKEFPDDPDMPRSTYVMLRVTFTASLTRPPRALGYYGPGLRIRQITQRSGGQPPLVRLYDYNDPETGQSSGQLGGAPNYRTTITYHGRTKLDDFASYTYTCSCEEYTSTSKYPLFSTQGSYTGYSYVTEYTSQDKANGKRTYQFTNFDSFNDLNNQTVFPYEPASPRAYLRGLPLGTQTWTAATSSQPAALVQADSLGYDYLPTSLSRAYGLKVGLQDRYQEAGNSMWPVGTGYSIEMTASMLTISKYPVESASYQVIAKTSTQYAGPHHTQLRTTYSYSPELFQVQRISSRSSMGDTQVQRFHYLTDYPTTSPLTAALQQAHRLTVPLETSQLLLPANSSTVRPPRLTAGLVHQYTVVPQPGAASRLFLNRIYVANTAQADTSQHFAGSNVPAFYEERARLTQVTAHGEPRTQVSNRHLITATLWDAAERYPLAQCQNARADEVFHEDFEHNSVASTAAAYSGQYGISGAYTVQWTPPNARPYWLRYRYRTGGRWFLRQQVYTGSGTPLGGGDAYDDVSIYPRDAQLTTYTYEPLVGETSQTGPDGRTTFFEYDGLGRLVRTRDEQGRILSQQQYHYAGQ